VALEFSAGAEDPNSVCDSPAFRDYYPMGPCMVMETYTGGLRATSRSISRVCPRIQLRVDSVRVYTFAGWIDSVGGSHQCTVGFASWLQALLASPSNMSVSIYMGHGGTNFGFESGSDVHYDPTSLNAIITSYDYNAPVMEDGRTGTLFAALRTVYESIGQRPPPVPTNASLLAYGSVQMTQCAQLWAAVSQGGIFAPSVPLAAPVSMEELQQPYGWLLYEVAVPVWSWGTGALLCLPQLQDRALIYVGGQWVGLLGWSEVNGGAGPCLMLPPAPVDGASPGATANLSVLVQVRVREEARS
jgi:hypothetical protein